ncbi:hypothetical protein IFT59_07235 [Rhizobium sp. CFBP 8752]|uniref:hypothetical protein n=1 Tax=Rhizobium sp. CFBP 8752 TaxID=2775301 RepID=UPI00177B4AAF|nr:hypothetical protein [Rhizobium sp. CFBP 8752]MBD8663045.1 hypothetical protein [Rhizobium sp. CFBP 8752]
MPRTSTNPRYNDRHLADRFEAQVADLRDRLRYEGGHERSDTLADIAKLEAQLSEMHC